VGGCDDLYALERSGKLDPMLRRLMRAGLVQLTSSDDPERNLPVTRAFVREAAARGARSC
jgi:hypothetical protein